MRKYYLNKHYLIGGLIVLSLCTFTGCNTNAENDNTINTTDQSHIETELTNGDGTTIATINADVTIPEYNSYSVATISKYEFTNSEIKRIADALFDNSEYYRTLTEEEYSADQLNAEIDKWNLGLNDANQLYNDGLINDDTYEYINYNYASYIEDLSTLLSSAPLEVDNNPICELTTITHISQAYSIDSEGNESVSDYTYTTTECDLEGTYNGNPCYLSIDINPFGDHSDINTNIMYIHLDSTDQIVWKNYTLKEVDTGLIKYKNFISVNPDIENQCKYSTSQAIDICNNFLESLGISDMAPMDICNLPVTAYNTSSSGFHYGSSIDSGYCGYELYYGKSINDITANLSLYSTGDFGFSMSAEEATQTVSGHESIILTVMDSGLISMRYYSPTVVEDVTSTDTPILEFDTIMDLSDSYFLDISLDEKTKLSRVKPIKISKVEFGLVRVVNEDNASTFSLVPAWEFYEDNTFAGSDTYPTPMLTINAIDGSRINSFTSRSIK